MPQLVLELRYCSHREQGVEMGLSINLLKISVSRASVTRRTAAVGATWWEAYQWPPFTLW